VTTVSHCTAFTALLFAASAALTLETHVDSRLAGALETGATGKADAHTI
jgi:hypothetical protein